jgi:hypothetical protein
MLKTKDIIERMEKFSILYDGCGISNEEVSKFYIEFMANTYKKRHNVSYVFDVDTLIFKVLTITLSYLVNVICNKYGSEDLINDMQEGDLVIYNKKRYEYKGIVNESIDNETHEYIHLIQGDFHRKISINEVKNLTPYYGGAKSLDGRGIKGSLQKKSLNMQELFGDDLEFNPTVLDNCSVLVMDRHEAEEIMNKIELKTLTNRKVKFLDIATVSYFTEHEEHRLKGNSGNNEPVIKITNTLSNARKLVMNQYENIVTNLVVFGNDRVSGNMSILEELLNFETLMHIQVNVHIGSMVGEELLNYYSNPEVFALTSNIINRDEFKFAGKNDITKSFRKKIDLINQRTVKFKNIGEIIPEEEYFDIYSRIRRLKNSELNSEILDSFVLQAYGLLKLFRTAIFTMQEYESLVDDLKIGQRKPIDKLSELEIDIMKLGDKYKEDGIFIVNKLKEFHDLLYDKSILKDELLSRLKYNHKHRKIAIVVPYAYYSNIIYELGIGQKVYGEISVYTANRFDNARCFDEIYVIGFTEGKRFNAYRNYNGRRVLILGYEYEKKFVQYHARKSEEYCKKLVAKSTKIECESKNIVVPEVEIDGDLSNFVRTKLTSINMADYINGSNYNGSSTSEATVAAIFDDGEKAFFTKGYKPYVLDAGNRNIIRKNVDKVNRGDVLVFTKNGTITQDIVDEMLIDLVENSLLDEKDIEAYKYWKRWKVLLRTHIDESDNDYRQVSKNFKNVGVNKQPQTIRTWIEPQYHITGPKEKNVFRKLGEVVDDEDLLINGEKYWRSTNKIRSIRTNILKLIGQSVMNEICGISFNDPIYKRISSNTQRIADLLEISSIEKIQPTKLPNSLVNRPLE